jgi:hypothetical protein
MDKNNCKITLGTGSMSARQRSVYYTDNNKGINEVEKGILHYPGAKQAIEKLVGKGVKRSVLFSWPLIIAVYFSKPERCKNLTELWNIQTYTMRRFPKRLIELAKQIEVYNAFPLIDPYRWIPRFPWKTEKERTLLAEVFDSLPSILRWYAKYLMGASRAVGKIVKHYGRNHLQNFLMVQFSDYISVTSKHYFDSDVSLLLTAAFQASGDDRIISEHTLKMLRKRHPGMRHPRPHLLGIGPTFDLLTWTRHLPSEPDGKSSK